MQGPIIFKMLTIYHNTFMLLLTYRHSCSFDIWKRLDSNIEDIQQYCINVFNNKICRTTFDTKTRYFVTFNHDYEENIYYFQKCFELGREVFNHFR